MSRVEDAHIAEVWLVADRLALMQQIGAVQAPTGWMIDSKGQWS